MQRDCSKTKAEYFGILEERLEYHIGREGTSLTELTWTHPQFFWAPLKLKCFPISVSLLTVDLLTVDTVFKKHFFCFPSKVRSGISLASDRKGDTLYSLLENPVCSV